MMSSRCIARALVLLLGAMWLAACSDRPTGYFPLNEDLKWTYRVTAERKSGITQSTFRVRSLGKYGSSDPARYVRRTDAGTDYILASDASGIYRVAKRLVVEDKPTPDPAPRYVLKYPLEVGTAWTALTHSYVLQRIYPYEETLSRGTNFNMNYDIVSVNETVKVPGGTFKNCILVEGNANMELYSDAVNGFTEIPISTREWYAEGVGLVKLERTETLETDVFSGGTMRFELTAFER